MRKTISRRSFIGTAGAAAAHAAIFAAGRANAGAPAAPSANGFPSNPFEAGGRWFKAALHVHTTTSDGDVDVPTRLAQYREAGYDVVAVTDHWKTNDLSGYSDGSFLAINGMEMHPETGTGAPRHHFVCLNLPHPFELAKDAPAQALIDKVAAAGGTVIYAHPYWTAHTLDEMLEVDGYVGMEVYNATCQLQAAKGSSHVHWDQLLNRGKILHAMATDDVHRSHEINLAWTMVRAGSLTATAVMDAIAAGRYYASCGPVIRDFRIVDGVVRVTCEPAALIRVLYDGQGGGKSFYAPDGGTIESAEWKISGKRRWIRAEVVDARGRHAWAGPLPAPGAPA